MSAAVRSPVGSAAGTIHSKEMQEGSLAAGCGQGLGISVPQFPPLCPQWQKWSCRVSHTQVC